MIAETELERGKFIWTGCSAVQTREKEVMDSWTSDGLTLDVIGVVRKTRGSFEIGL